MNTSPGSGSVYGEHAWALAGSVLGAKASGMWFDATPTREQVAGLALNGWA